MSDDGRYADLDEYSVRFLRSVQHHHGKTVGAEVVHKLQDILGKEWGGRVIFNILSDNHRGAPEFFSVDARNCDRKINAIKEVRSICTYMGLKEAKDFIEASTYGGGPQKTRIERNPNITPEEHDRKVRQALQELRNIGCVVVEF